MVPSFRLIGYYHNTNGEIVADSIWVDVKDECEGRVSYISHIVLFTQGFFYGYYLSGMLRLNAELAKQVIL